MPHSIWERTRSVNLDGSFFIVQGMSYSPPGMSQRTDRHLILQAVANQMKNQLPQGGSIIGLSSISALVGGEYQWFVLGLVQRTRHAQCCKAITRPQKQAFYRSCRAAQLLLESTISAQMQSFLARSPRTSTRTIFPILQNERT